MLNRKTTIEEAKLVLHDKYIPISKVRKAIKALEELFVDESEYEELTLRLREREQSLSKIYRQKTINFRRFKNGLLGIGARPSLDKINLLKIEGVEMIITLLKKEEKLVKELGDKVKDCEIIWEWFPLSASNLRTDKAHKKAVNDLYDNLISRLDRGEKIFMHCAAGVHRTGAFSNGLLRKMGFTEEEAKEEIYKMRPVTAIERISKHWNWSEKIIE